MRSITLQSFTASESGLANVSLLTGNIEAKGHGLFVDEASIDGAMRLLLGKTVRAYLKHDGAERDRLGEEVGFFSGIYRDGMQIKAARFEFLEAWKAEKPTIHARLVEMAEKHPEQFGVSLVLEYVPVWVMRDGSEMSYGMMSSPPADAVRSVPSMRIKAIRSADLVGTPAANPNGLLSAVDAPQHKEKPMETETKTISLDAHTAELAALAESHKAALATLTAAAAEKDAAIARLTTEHDAAKKRVAELEATTAEQSKKIGDLETFDARKMGVAPVRITAAVVAQKSAALKTPEEKLAAYEAMPDGPEKDAFRRANRTDLFAALSARK